MTAATHAETHAEMHAEHCQWGSDLSLWRDEIGIWQKEMNLVRAEMSRLVKVLHRHQAAIRAHAQALGAHAEQMKEHEYALADFEAGSPADNRLLLLTKKHRQEAAQHAEQREAYEGIKTHQHALMAQWAIMMKTLREMV